MTLGHEISNTLKNIGDFLFLLKGFQFGCMKFEAFSNLKFKIELHRQFGMITYLQSTFNIFVLFTTVISEIIGVQNCLCNTIWNFKFENDFLFLSDIGGILSYYLILRYMTLLLAIYLLNDTFPFSDSDSESSL